MKALKLSIAVCALAASTPVLADKTALEQYVVNMGQYAAAMSRCDTLAEPRQQVMHTLTHTFGFNRDTVNWYLAIYQRARRDAQRGHSGCNLTAAGWSIHQAANALERALILSNDGSN